jgi:hypothetical protein
MDMYVHIYVCDVMCHGGICVLFMCCVTAFYMAYIHMMCRYLSIGLRQAMMFCAHLHPSAWLYSYLLPPAATWSSEPTVDRTLGAITLKTKITLSMALSQFFAAGLRISLWYRGQLDTLQQEMMVKNVLFLGNLFLFVMVCLFIMLFLSVDICVLLLVLTACEFVIAHLISI